MSKKLAEAFNYLCATYGIIATAEYKESQILFKEGLGSNEYTSHSAEGNSYAIREDLTHYLLQLDIIKPKAGKEEIFKKLKDKFISDIENNGTAEDTLNKKIADHSENLKIPSEVLRLTSTCIELSLNGVSSQENQEMVEKVIDLAEEIIKERREQFAEKMESLKASKSLIIRIKSGGNYGRNI